MRREARRRAVLRVVSLPLLLPLGLVIIGKQFVFEGNALWVLGVPAVVVCSGVALARVRRSLEGEPVLLVGRVTDGVVYVEGDDTGWPEMLSWISRGYFRTVRVSVSAACSLMPGGALVSNHRWLGDHELAVRGSAYQRIVETERCVLLCTPDGSIIDRLTDVARHRARLPA